jgi:hypothetical protein
MSGFCVSSGKYVSIVIKIKYINSDNMSNIYDKLKFIINYTYFTTTDIYFIKKYIHITIVDTRNETIP